MRSAIAVTVDIVIFTLREGDLQVLLVKRKNPPFQGRWAIPGGFVEVDESLEDAAARELREETGYACDELRPVGGGPLDPSKETNRVHLFAGTGARRVGEQELDVTEEIEVVLVPVAELRGRIRAGAISAPTSVAGIYLALDALGRL